MRAKSRCFGKISRPRNDNELPTITSTTTSTSTFRNTTTSRFTKYAQVAVVVDANVIRF